MDGELAKAIGSGLSTNPEVLLLQQDEAERVRTQVARHFGFSDRQAWWWQNVSSTRKLLTYSAGEGLELLSSLIPAGTQRTYVFVTDDDPPPWLCLSGPPQALLDLVAAQRFFEFFLVDEDMTWIIFDTHDNTFVGHGPSLANRPEHATRGPRL